MYYALLILIPTITIWLSIKFPIIERFGLVTFAYFAGFLTTFITHYLPEALKQDIAASQSNMLDTSIALALPMILISFDIRKSFIYAKDISISFLLSVISYVSIALLLPFIFKDKLDHLWEYVSMGTGVYIGGTVNMAAIKTAMNIDESLFTNINSYDILVSTFYIMFQFSICIPIVNYFLPKFKKKSTQEINDNKYKDTEKDTARDFVKLVKKKAIPDHLLTFGTSILIVVLSLGISELFPKTYSSTVAIISISTLAILASMLNKVKKIQHSYKLGMYFLIIFSFTAGSMIDINMFTDMDFTMLGFVSLFIWGGMAIHITLCKIFKIDGETFLVSSIASIMSVPFIPLICSKLDNKHLLVPGISVAILSYTIATYIGITMAYLIQSWGF